MKWVTSIGGFSLNNLTENVRMKILLITIFDKWIGSPHSVEWLGLLLRRIVETLKRRLIIDLGYQRHSGLYSESGPGFVC